MNKKAVFMVGRRVIEGLDGRSGGTCSRLRAACSTDAAGESRRSATGADGPGARRSAASPLEQ